MEQAMIPQGYKQTEVGVIPEDWIIKPLSKLTVLMTNGFVGTAKTHYTDCNDGITYIQGYNVEENSFNYRGIKKVTPEFHKKNSKSCLKKGDLLMVQTGDVGLVTIIPPELEGANCHALIINRFKNEYDSRYFAYFLNSSRGRQRLKELEIGTTMKHINVGDLLHFEIPFPPNLKEQTLIAITLSDTDALINELEKLIQKKQAIKTATMQQLLTGLTRLPQFALREDGTPKGMKDSELGEIPEDWDIYDFGSLVNYKKGYPFKSDDYQVSGVRIIRVSDTSYSEIKDGSAIYISEKLAKQYPAWSLQEGDLIFSTVGSKPPMYDSLVGKVIQITKKHASNLLNQNAVRIRAKSRVAGIQSLLINHFRTERYIDFIEIIYRGNANQASITLENLFGFKIPLPFEAHEQTAIATTLSDMDTEIQALEQRLSKTRQIKQGMMQELLTGRTRLIKPKQLKVANG